MKFDCERSEITEVIYDNVDTVGRPDLGITEKQQSLQHTGSVLVKNKKHRAAEVCLCVLCFLLLIAVIVLYVCFTTERHQLLTHISNLTEKREQIMEHNNNLNKESNIQKCENRLHSWLYEQDQQREPIKWIYYNFSFYYISSERKSWIDSRRDCQDRGADLAILNKDNEQAFLQKVAETDYFWIGLINTEEGWKWIYGTLTPNGSGTSNCAAVGASANFNFPCHTAHRWICKRTLNNH